MEKFSEGKKKLKKELTLLDVFSISTGAMISSGIFVLPGLAYAQAGPAVILSYILAGIMYLPVMFSYAELSTAMPRSGGSYFFVDRSMGPVVGTVGGMSEWLSLILKSSFALIGIGAFATILFPGINELHIKFIALIFGVIFVFLNLRGAKEAGKLQIVLVFGLLAILALYIVRGFTHIEPMNFKPFVTNGSFSIVSTAGLVYISFAGLTKVVNVGEEIKDPGKNIPLGMFLAFSTVMFIYAFAVLVTVGIVPAKDLAGSLAPLAIGAEKIMGPVGKILLVVAALFSFATTANAGVMAASRTPVSMSRDGHLPPLFQKINGKTGTPTSAILMTGGLMGAFILLLDIRTFVKTASVVMLVLFILVSVAVLIMRESKMYNYQPIFKSPLYPYIQVAGIIGYSLLLFTLGTKPLIMASVLLFAGLAWHWVYARIQINRESALIRVLERFMGSEFDRDLVKENLGEELKEIIHERDEIVEDHFDKLVKNAIVMDVGDDIGKEELFHEMSKLLETKLGLPHNEIYEKFEEREKEAGSVLFPGLAMPHIIVGCKCSISLVIARSKKGIQFSPNFPPVHALFAFVGSAQTRTMYLRSLVAISEIAQQDNFNEYWMKAKSIKELRNIILMGERKRVHLIYCMHCPEEVLFEDKVLCRIKCEDGEDCKDDEG